MYSIMKRSLLAFASLSFTVSALKLPALQTKRSTFTVSNVNTGFSASQSIGVNDNQDMIYMVNITMGGTQYTVQLDSGSSDLWITAPGTMPGTQSGLNVNISYGTGYAAGPISTTDVTFAGTEVKKQAFVAATQVNNPVTDYGGNGVLGIGFTRLSSIDMAVNNTGGSWGRSLMYNMFAMNASQPNLVAVLLERTTDTANQTQGMFTIGEYDPRYAGVANTEPIPTFPPSEPSRWTFLVDGITVNGKSVPLSSAVPGVPSNKAVGLMDSGTSLVYAPTNVVAALYGSVAGAQYSDSLGKWIVPCNAEVDASITISGRQFDIHPLDTVQPTSDGSQTCVGSWLPQSLSVGKAEFDYLFGDAVMRSMYTVYDFGDFIPPTNQMGNPYMRLWSLVDGTEASKEFNQIRNGTSQSQFLSNDNVNAPTNNSSPNSSNPNGDVSGDISDLQTKVHNILKWAPLAIGVAALNTFVMLIVLIVSIAGCVRRRKNNRSIAPSGSYVPLPLGASSHNYRPVSLQETKYNPGARYSD